jgi:hypothetical protein
MRQVAFWFPIALVGPWTWWIFGNLTDAVSTDPHMAAAATAGTDLWTALDLSVWAVATMMLMQVAMVFKPK